MNLCPSRVRIIRSDLFGGGSQGGERLPPLVDDGATRVGDLDELGQVVGNETELGTDSQAVLWTTPAGIMSPAR